jgi:uncharacterized protein (TIGR03067 family)
LPQELPAVFGRYELRKLLGKGGMGVVYLAYDTQLNRLVALKIPALPTEHHAAFQERFFHEARTAAALSHPGLCPVYDVGQINGIAYLTMAYIHGISLSERLRRGPPLTVGEAARIARDVATAMQEAHGHGVVHRDLKPSNILLNQRQQPVVTDFGLARRVLPTDQRRLTQSGALVGTPAYMAPEQAAGDTAALGPACDIYSLGVILYEMLTGRVPFAERGLGRLLAQIERDPPPLPAQFRAGLDPNIQAVCLKALAKRPGDRFPSMADFAAALPTCAEPPTTATAPLRRRRRARFAVAAASIAMLVLGALSLYFGTKSGTESIERDPPSAKNEEGLLQGTWMGVEQEKKGDPVPEELFEAAPNVRLVLTGDRFTLVEGIDARPISGTFEIDPAMRPRQIDLKADLGVHGISYPGIYELEGDFLVLCLGNPLPGERPTEFATKPAADGGFEFGQKLIVFKRKKE